MGYRCCIKSCGTKTGVSRDRCLIKINDKNREHWLGLIGENLTVGRPRRKTLHVCDLHFKNEDIERFYQHRLSDGSIFKLTRSLPRLRRGAAPCFFDKNDRNNNSACVTSENISTVDKIHTDGSCHRRVGLDENKTSGITFHRANEDYGREDLEEVDIKDPRFPATYFEEKSLRNGNKNGLKRQAVTPPDEIGNLEPSTERIKLEENLDMTTDENKLLAFEFVDWECKKENVALDELSNILEENYDTAAVNTDEKKDIFKSSTYSRDEERLQRIIRLLEEQLAAVISENDELRKENEALKAMHTHTRSLK